MPDACNSEDLKPTSMANWREKAEQMFPELAQGVREAETPYLLWSELFDAFECAYGPPRNESLIKRVYAYADWCIDLPQGETAEDDLSTCVAVSFYEHIPQHPDTRADMPRWFSLRDFLGMEKLFRYHLSDGEFEALKQHFVEHQDMYVDRSRKP